MVLHNYQEIGEHLHKSVSIIPLATFTVMQWLHHAHSCNCCSQCTILAILFCIWAYTYEVTKFSTSWQLFMVATLMHCLINSYCCFVLDGCRVVLNQGFLFQIVSQHEKAVRQQKAWNRKPGFQAVKLHSACLWLSGIHQSTVQARALDLIPIVRLPLHFSVLLLKT